MLFDGLKGFKIKDEPSKDVSRLSSAPRTCQAQKTSSPTCLSVNQSKPRK